MKKLGLLVLSLVLVINGMIYAAGGDLGAGEGADGSEAMPWLIEDFADFAAFCGDASKWAEGVYTRLEADIDLDPNLPGREIYTQAPIAGDTDSESDGFDGTEYDGNFDGNGHLIGNLKIEGTDYCGFFGYIGENGSIKNIGVENANITGLDFIGALAGFCYGNDNDDYIYHCYSTGIISGDSNIGGLTGVAPDCNIRECYSNCTVTSEHNGGGLAGGSGNITQCYSTGQVIIDNYLNNGLVGNYYHGGRGLYVFDCFWDVETSGIADSTYEDNSLVGKTTAEMQDFSTFEKVGWVQADYKTGRSGWYMPDNSYPQLIWQHPDAVVIPDVRGMTASEAQARLEAEGIIIGNIINVGSWQVPAGMVAGISASPGRYFDPTQYTIDIYVSAGSNGDGSESNPYEIACQADLFAINNAPDACFIMTVDVYMDTIEYEGAIISAGLSGKFDGKNHEIFNLTSKGGLFSGIDGAVSNLGIIDALVISTGDSIAILAGSNYGIISNCYTSGFIKGGSRIGGLVGLNDGSVINCYSSGSVSGDYYVGGLVGDNDRDSLINCYSSGSVTGDGLVGGLVGVNRGSLVNCYSSGSVTGDGLVGGLVGRDWDGSVSNCYSSGEVTGSGDNVGGLVGDNDGSVVSNCFWDVVTSGIADTEDGAGDTDGMIGKTTAEMQDINTFINDGWDFVNETANGTSEIWQMPESGGYPIQSSFNDYVPVLLDGEGSRSYPYLISNAIELGAVYHYDSSAYYKLTADIELSGIQWSTAIIPLFDGHFDGDGYIINNLTISGFEYLGVFGKIAGSAKIVNVGLENISITGSGSYVGGLVGDNYRGNVSNCYSSGDVTGYSGVGGLVGDNYRGNVSNCYSSGNVTGDDSVGGLVGRDWEGIVSNCYSSGDVSGDYSVGGLVGYNYRGSVSNCYSSGTVTGGYFVGGLVGYNSYGSVSNCYSSGTVTGEDDYIGGLVGRNSDGSVSNCYSSCAVTGGYFVGGLVGDNFYGSVVSNCFWDVVTSGIADTEDGADDTDGMIGKTTAEMQDINTFINVGWDFVNETANGTSEIWQMPESGGYPIQSSFNDYVPVLLDGEGSRSYPYLISNAIELGAVYHYDSSAYYKLTADIELSGIQWSTAIIPLFDGHFDGGGHIINNLTISGGGYLGMFGKIAGSAEICDVGLENISITGSGSYVGGLVGWNQWGSVSNCYSSGDVTGDDYIGGLVGNNSGSVSNCYSSGSVTGDDYIGGLVGENYFGDISNSYSSGDVTGDDNVGGLVGVNDYGSVSNCYSSGNVTGDDSVGGLVGVNDYGSVSNCYSSGDVTGSGSYVGGLVGVNDYGSVSNCYSSGNVTGYDSVGGLVGRNYNGSVSNCYSSGDVTGSGSYVGGLVGDNYRGNVSNCYSSGNVTGDDSVGGLVGRNYDGSVSNCFWDIETSGIADPEAGLEDTDGTIGKTTAEMQDVGTFLGAGWDFVGEDGNGNEDLWRMPYEMPGYPILAWEKDIAADIAGGYGVDMTDAALLASGWMEEYGLADLEELAVNWLNK